MQSMLLRYVATLALVVYVSAPVIVLAQATVHEEYQETLSAVVVEVISTETSELPGLDTTVTIQEISARLLSGSRAGETVTFTHEFAPLKAGDDIFVDRRIDINGREYFIMKDVDRRSELVLLAILFVGLIVWLSRWQGLRALGCLLLSIAAIIFVLVPALLAGYDPALTSFVISGVILAIVLFGTHGRNALSTTSALGTFGAVALTCIIAYIFVTALRFSGFSSDEAIFLNFATGGQLDFAGLLLGSIIIGMLGVLDDVSITQASVVAELKRANDNFGPFELYRRALKVGRDHVASLVNTLALAYVGVSLPLILLLARAETNLTMTLNQELVAVELARIMIGSIGIVLAVPLTTALAAWYFGTYGVSKGVEEHAHHH